MHKHPTNDAASTTTRIDGKPDVRAADGLIHGEPSTSGMPLEEADGSPDVSGSAPLITFDICLGVSSRDAGARVLITVVGQASADALVTALRTATLFQCEGLKPFARCRSGV